MKIRDFERARKDFNATYAVNYPPPERPEDEKNNGGALIFVWGIVAIAGAVISMPHTLGMVVTTFNAENWVKIIVGIAVFFGVELALIGVAYTEAYNALETGKKPAPLTIRSVLRIIAFRLGVVNTLPAPQTDNGGRASNGGLLLILFCSALLFNQADASQNAGLLDLSKYVAGGLAPLLLLLAGHEFAHALASRVLAQKITQRRYEELITQWKNQMDESWRVYAETLTTHHTTPRARLERPPQDTPQTDFLSVGMTHNANDNGRSNGGTNTD